MNAECSIFSKNAIIVAFRTNCNEELCIEIDVIYLRIKNNGIRPNGKEFPRVNRAKAYNLLNNTNFCNDDALDKYLSLKKTVRDNL